MKHVKHFIESVYEICFPTLEGSEHTTDKDDPFWVKVVFLLFIVVIVVFIIMLDY